MITSSLCSPRCGDRVSPNRLADAAPSCALSGIGAAELGLTRSSSPASLPTPEDDRVLTPGRSLTPMTPKRPPKGLVLPNAFGLLSMQSFKSAGAPATIDEARPRQKPYTPTPEP